MCLSIKLLHKDCRSNRTVFISKHIDAGTLLFTTAKPSSHFSFTDCPHPVVEASVVRVKSGRLLSIIFIKAVVALDIHQ